MVVDVVRTDTMPVTPLRWWSSAQLAQIASRLDELRDRWLREWMDDAACGASPTVTRCRNVHEASDMPISRLRQHASQPQLWVSRSWEDGALGAALLQMSPAFDTATALLEIEDAAWEDLLTELGTLWEPVPASEGGAVESAPTVHSRPWSGAVDVEMTLTPGLWLRLYIGPVMAAGMLPIVEADRHAASSMRVSLAEALADQPLRLQASLASVEIALGTVAGLAKGDVVLLPHSLISPLCLSTMEGELICHAYLGRHGNNRALRIMHAGDDLNS